METNNILNSENLEQIDKAINKTLDSAMSSAKLKLQKINCEKYLKNIESHGTDLTGSSYYYSLWLYFFCDHAISGYRENLVCLIFTLDSQNPEFINTTIANVYEEKVKKINSIDLQSNLTDGVLCDIVAMFVDSVEHFLKKELFGSGVVPKKMKKTH